MKRFAWLLAAVAVGLPLSIWLALRGSLPQLDGELDVAGLERSVMIERDALGVPTLTAATRTDLAFATGFVHGQDRFFQMDLSRRAAAGRLAELLGPALIETDRKLRVHGFAEVATEVLVQLPADRRAVLESYAAGVNAAMERWRVRPPEYLLLRVEPSRWSAVDSLLVAYAMFLDLNDSSGEDEIERALLRKTLPEEVVAFLDPPGTQWDAPLIGRAFAPVPIPGPEALDLRTLPESPAPDRVARLEAEFDGVAVGSNNWAVSGRHTASGGALLANDMHLGLRMPNVWYRARLVVAGGGGAGVDLAGVTLPGVPVLIAGSNGRVAWGYTNSYGDWTDIVVIEPDPDDPARYLTAAGSRAYGTRSETIHAAGADTAVHFEVRTTIWGPVIGELEGQPIALAWTAHRPQATNLEHLALERARSVGDALAIASTIGAPVQNFVAADSEGHIGWTLMGRVPVRAGYDPAVPSPWHAPGTGWVGWAERETYPRVIDPPAGRIWTANARVLDAERLPFVGDSGYDRGARAGQIRDALFALDAAAPVDMLAIQLDDRALFLARWRDLLLELLDAETTDQDAGRAAARGAVEAWSGRAAIDDAGYRIVRAFRLATVKRVFDSLTAPARLRFPEAEFEPTPQFEGSAWQLVMEQPTHLVAPGFADWRTLLLDTFDQVLEELEARCGEISRCTWGERNRLTMRHPIAQAVPVLSRFLDMPSMALPGDGDMPRVQAPTFGASERFAVSPGDEANGYFQMPGGQSGHPLSNFYRAGHDAWSEGHPGPFLPGPAVHTLRLIAAASHERHAALRSMR